MDKRNEVDAAPVMRRLIFPRGLRDKIAAYATGMRTMRQTAEHFSRFGLTREMLQDIFGGRVVVEDGDVETIKAA